MSGSNKFARGGGRAFNRMTSHPGRGVMQLGRGVNLLKEKGKSEELAMKGRGLAHSYGLGGGAAAGTFQQEKFELVSCKEQNTLPKFAMAIRLTPGLLETIRKAEELGEATSIKFGPGASNNVIKVAGEEFTFSAAIEPGYLCDVYEEEKRGQDGNGRLVESGAVWRKLAVTRTLNEKDKNRVKQRSEEAERQQKSRQVLIVDHANLTNKTTTSADVNGRRAPIIKQKNQPPQKKRKTIGHPPVIPPPPPPPPAVRPRQGQGAAEKPPVTLTTTKAVKATVASSPDRPFGSLKTMPPGQGTSMPPSNLKGVEESGVATGLKHVAGSQKDKVPSPALTAGVETGSLSKAAGPVNTIELRNTLITLLTDNPKGMTIKAVEKAVGETRSSVRPDKKQIEKVIKSIASYHAPGKYMLKEGVEKGAYTKPSPGSGSSLDSPPLAESIARIEVFQEAREAIGNAESPATAVVAQRQDAKKVDGSTRGAASSLRKGTENPVSRAIRKVENIVRSNADRSHPFGQDQASVLEVSPPHKPDDLKGSTDPQEMGDTDHVSIGGDESPLSVLPEKSLEEAGLQNDIQDIQTQNISVSRDGNVSDASDSSSESGSTSSSGSDSETDSASGSRSGSGSESDSDASSSSGSEEENVDVDVNIISDDEDKAGDDEADVSKQKSKSKDNRSSLERLDSKAHGPVPRVNNKLLQTPKDADVVLTTHGLEDAEVKVETVRQVMDKVVDGDIFEKEMKGGNSDEDVDVVSCEDTTSHQDQGNGCNRSRRRIEDSVELGSSAGDKCVAQDNLHTFVQSKAGSESDHSIEEYETRAENSGVRATGVKTAGEQQGEGHGVRKERSNRVSPGIKAHSGVNLIETVASSSRQQREMGSLKVMTKGPTDGPPSGATKALPLSDGAPLKTVNADRSQHGILSAPKSASDLPNARTSREPPPKGKPAELKKKEAKSAVRLRKSVGSDDMQDKGVADCRSAQPPNKIMEAHGRGIKPKFSGDVETPLKIKDGVSSSREEPGLVGKGPETREPKTLDQIVKSGAEGDAVERKNPQKKQNKDTSALGKPAEIVTRPKEGEKIFQHGQYKNMEASGKAGRSAKQARRPGPKRNDIPERLAVSSEVTGNLVEDGEIQKRSFRDGEVQRNSPRLVEPLSRNSNGNEASNGKQKDSLKPDIDRPDATSYNSTIMSMKAKSSGVSDDLEQGELRDMVADLKVRDPTRSEQVKDSSDKSRPPLNKPRGSPEKDRPRNGGKLVDMKKRSPAEVRKQQSAKSIPQKVEVPISVRESVLFNVQRSGGSEDRLDSGGGHAFDLHSKNRANFGDHQEKGMEGRSQKRVADEHGECDAGRLPKRVAVDFFQTPPLVRGEVDSTSHKYERSESNRKNAAVDVVIRGSSGDGGSQLPPTSSTKGVAENGRFPAPKNKVYDVLERENTDRRPPSPEGKARASLLGSGAKREALCNGPKEFMPSGSGNIDEFFVLYEKRTPELKGPVSCYNQYLEYRKEYEEKYPVYTNLNDVLDRDKNEFLNFSRDIGNAKAREDKTQLGKIYGDVTRNYLLCRKRFKRMKKTFEVLHHELAGIKQRCKEYAEKYGPR